MPLIYREWVEKKNPPLGRVKKAYLKVCG